MEKAGIKYTRLYDACYAYASKFLFLPKGKPTLYIDECPSARFPNEENASETYVQEYGIIINRVWADRCLRENVPEYEFLLFHELRHYHQREAITRFIEIGVAERDSQTDIQAWMADYNSYTRNEGTDESRAQNAAQMIERDANAYALNLLRLYHVHDSMQLMLGLPDITADDAERYLTEKSELRRAVADVQRTGQKPIAKPTPVRKPQKIGRNEPCPCGSGLKYKKCKCQQYH